MITKVSGVVAMRENGSDSVDFDMLKYSSLRKEMRQSLSIKSVVRCTAGTKTLYDDETVFRAVTYFR